MEHCKTCKWWTPVNDIGGYGYADALGIYDPVTFDRYDDATLLRLHGFSVAQCTSPHVRFYERPARDGVALFDGSQYFAQIITGEDYGCIKHEMSR